MRISIRLPRPGGSADGTIPACTQIAAATEAAGLHAVSATDHPFPRLAPDSMAHQAHDPFTLLTVVGAGTRDIRLQFSLLVTAYRNPFLTARMIATLDQACAGRVMATFGAGYLAPEFAALGATFPGRGRRVPESVAAMRAAWSGSPVHLSGSGWSSTGNTMLPGCVQRPHPPLWRGGNAPQAMAQAAASFDGWAPVEVDASSATRVRTPCLTLAGARDAATAFHEAWAAAGRAGTPDLSMVRTRTDWLADAGRIVDEVGRLASDGFTWVELNPAGESIAAWLRSIETMATALRDAGLLTPG